jgi:glutathione S-transferase
MIFYTWHGSAVCRPVAMFIADHRIKATSRFVDLLAGEQAGPAFLAINPNGAVPVLDDGRARLTEASAILKYLADKVRSPAYPKDLPARARVNAVMDWINTGLYRTFGYGFCYPQVLEALAWPDPNTQSQVLARGREGSRRLLGVMNDNLLGGRRAWLCGEQITIADYLASGILSMGELTGCVFTDWPHVQRWYEQMQARANWKSANAGLYEWAAAVKGPDYVKL